MKPSEKIKQLKMKIDNNMASDYEYRMYKYLTRISGMKGMEKSLKDKLGKDLNNVDSTTDVVNRVFDRIDKRMKNKD